MADRHAETLADLRRALERLEKLSVTNDILAAKDWIRWSIKALERDREHRGWRD